LADFYCWQTPESLALRTSTGTFSPRPSVLGFSKTYDTFYWWKMVMRRAHFACVLICLALGVPSFAHHIKPGTTRTLPITTSSPKARDLFVRAVTDYENLYLERANIGWRAAVEADPNFALAYTFIGYNSRNPAEAAAAREKAKALAAKVTPGEQLLIQWITSIQENNFLAGIPAMNDMLEMYPKDKQIAYMAGNWMMGQNNYEQARKTLERALVLDKNYPPALNDLAYCYAQSREFPRAFEMMERYVSALPTLPNPQDSYAEILRMSGNFEGAIEHYRAALKIDPEFDYSQLGLGDTYAVMGNQEQARAEYEKAIQHAHTDADRLSYALQEATTWARANNFTEADKAFAAVAEKAHAAGFDLTAAQAHRMMSLYQTDDVTALLHLEAAQAALTQQASLTQSERDDERARILRYRAVRADHAGNRELAAQTLQQLETMAGSTRSAVVQGSYHGAAGALLMGQQKIQEAISHLEEDEDNPYSLELLSRAYSSTGDAEKRHEVEVKLRATNAPTMEQALVVPGVRSRRPEGE
jgi:tetratricopeptide (TPR) repeat protein